MSELFPVVWGYDLVGILGKTVFVFSEIDPRIYIKDISHCLQCPMEIVEDELYMMVDEGILLNVFELRCFVCNQRITTYEFPEQFLRCTMPECPYCYFQPESLTMNDLVNTFVLRTIDVAL